MRTLPLTRNQLNPDLPIKRILIGALAVLAIGLTLVLVALSDARDSRVVAPTPRGSHTLIHFYGTGAPPSTRAARPRTPSGAGPSQHFYGLQP